ncbi:MAG: BspA family leucine-rich repeat surface protein [Erysipelotrichaceae bacterium]|nr:BspA family leucine-rich repeat surface protein [Erysipelotrichaceae bacterium]
MSAWTEGTTLTLLQDVTVTGGDREHIYTNTLDLNGHQFATTGDYEILCRATLTIKDSSQSETGLFTVNAQRSGSLIWAHNGNLILEGGTLSNDATSAPVVDFWSADDCSFTMNGGKITGTASHGAIRFNSNCSFTMTGGEISGLTDTNGLFTGSTSAPFTVSGTAKIQNNVRNGVTENVYLASGKVITIGAALDPSASIGVTMANPGIFTASVAGIVSKDYISNFTSDDSDYSVSADGNELTLTVIEEEPEAYAILTDEGDFIFFRSSDYYEDGSYQTVTINDDEYDGYVYGNIESLNLDAWNMPWHERREQIKRAYVAEGYTIHPDDMVGWFYDCSSLESFDASGFDTSVTDGFSFLFDGCSSLTELDLRQFDTSNAEYINCMFINCSSLSSLDISSFRTDKVLQMNGMFMGCSSLTSLDLSHFKTPCTTSMYRMFDGCTSLANLDISNFDTSHILDEDVIGRMTEMFRMCSSLTEVVLGPGFTLWREDAMLPIGHWSHEDPDLLKT